jgi:hypothetical protein
MLPGSIAVFARTGLPEARFSRTARGIAQSGSAPALGAGCREFESLYPDQLNSKQLV